MRYDITYTLKELNKNQGKRVDKKLGPKEIGVASGFKPAVFKFPTGSWANLMHPKSHLDKHVGEEIEHKPGPQEIGRNKDYKVPEYAIEVSNVRYDLFYLISKLNVNEGKKAPAKQGPVEIGKNKNYRGEKYSINTEDL